MLKFLGLVTLLFIILKFAGVIAWAWIFVCIPAMIMFIVALAYAMVFVGIIELIKITFEDRWRR